MWTLVPERNGEQAKRVDGFDVDNVIARLRRHAFIDVVTCTPAHIAEYAPAAYFGPSPVAAQIVSRCRASALRRRARRRGLWSSPAARRGCGGSRRSACRQRRAGRHGLLPPLDQSGIARPPDRVYQPGEVRPDRPTPSERNPGRAPTDVRPRRVRRPRRGRALLQPTQTVPRPGHPLRETRRYYRAEILIAATVLWLLQDSQDRRTRPRRLPGDSPAHRWHRAAGAARW